MDPDNATITYTVRELLESIRRDQQAGFAQIQESLNHKADKADIENLHRRVDKLDSRVATLETGRHDQEVIHGAHVARLTRAEKWLSTSLGILAVAAAVVVPLLSTHTI